MDSDDEAILERNKYRKLDLDPIRDQIFELNADELMQQNFLEIE